MTELETTQRAYTLRLRGIDENDHSWRDTLWATHEAVNKGAKVFGDWLLTLRGGLDHRLADEGNPKQHKDRRILLALSWLSVEDSHGAPKDEGLIVARGNDEVACRSQRLREALASILKIRDLAESEIAGWLADCVPSLSAAIREDAVWVNRSAAFDSIVVEYSELTREEIWDFFTPFFSTPAAYLKPARGESDKDDSGSVAATAKEQKAKDLVQKAGGWLSQRMGTGDGADFSRMANACQSIANWAAAASDGLSTNEAFADLARYLESFAPKSIDFKGVLSTISGPGYKSATKNRIMRLQSEPHLHREQLDELSSLALEDFRKCSNKCKDKGLRPYSTRIIKEVESACGFTYRQSNGPARHREFSVMLDHAARRVNVAHSWIKNAEAERRQFELDARRLDEVPESARTWLQKYCNDRATVSGSLEPYRIRKRAIDGWDKIVDRWSRSDCKTFADRILAARQLQDDPEIDKFGDIQLFEAIAADDAICVWKSGTDSSAQPLKDFVAASEADAKKMRFKVPAYRHPDALRHPVFTDFGNSRWTIDFSAHRAPTKLEGVSQKIEKLCADVAELEDKRDKAAEPRRELLARKTDEIQRKLAIVRQEYSRLADSHRVETKVWNGATIEMIAMRWSSKRLVSDIAIAAPSEQVGEATSKSVPRSDRLGRASAGAGSAEHASLSALFEQDYWNGRLQAPRRQLDAIARYIDRHGWDETARKMLTRIRWLITFSAELVPQGPWCDFAEREGLRPDSRYWPHSEENKGRQGHAKLLLSRLPALRVLSVDLGHRFAAACAVWQTLSKTDFEKECSQASAKGGRVQVDDLYAIIEQAAYDTNRMPNSDQAYPKAKKSKRTSWYRRIGSDVLPDGASNPAPWARLDRQFLIKLQGENRGARKASREELSAACGFEEWIGFTRGKVDTPHNLRVDSLMSSTVRMARLALARHGRRARIAHNLITDVRSLPGARESLLDDNARIALLTDTLVDWHAFATDGRWDDSFARKLWNEKLAPLAGGFEVQRATDSESSVDETNTQRRKVEQALRNRIDPLAATLTANAILRRKLCETWISRWQADDENWRKNLHWLARWLMPRGKALHKGTRWNVGGLSITRIATLVEFRRKVQVGYFTRMKPDGIRAEISARFGQSTLDTIECLKENRIKQLASRIVEGALGIGVECTATRDLPRPRERIQLPRFAPCHAVVIEDLSHYRPEETRTRRENRATMDWKSAETRKRLADHCQLYGLHLRDVNPQYTSRQDSRTGAPGIRCVEVMAEEFLSTAMWRKQVASALKKTNLGQGVARDRYLVALNEKWTQASEKEKKLGRLRIPLKGGDLFTSVRGDKTRFSAIQADLNAAANIGLRAIMDPDFPGKWWYVPCDPKTGRPVAEKVKGGILVNVGPVFVPADPNLATKTTNRKTKKKSPSKQREVVNQWRDPEAVAIRGVEGGEQWRETSGYWNLVQTRVTRLLCQQGGISPV